MVGDTEETHQSQGKEIVGYKTDGSRGSGSTIAPGGLENFSGTATKYLPMAADNKAKSQ